MYLAAESSGAENPGRPGSAVLAELERVYAYLYSRVGNRADAEDLIQHVALKALPRLRQEASEASIRAYLYATAHSVLGAFWAQRFKLPQAALPDDLADERHAVTPGAPASSQAWLEETLAAVSPHHREVLELRFLQGFSIRETAAAMGKTAGAVKLMQLRALRAAAAKAPSRSHPGRRPPAAAPGSAS